VDVNEYIDNKLVHSIHTSGRKSYRGCRRRWDWIYNHYFYPTVSAKPLEFGIAFHKAMEAGYDPKLPKLDYRLRLSLAKVAFKKKVQEQLDAFKANPAVTLTPEEADSDYKERIKLGLGMLNYFFTEVAPEIDHGYNIYATEIAFEVPITDTLGNQLWCKCTDCWRRYVAWVKAFRPDWEQDLKPTMQEQADWDYDPIRKWDGLPVTYGGRIDLLVQDEDGGIWIVDWKTAAQLTREENEGFLELDDQITSYVWALWLLGLDVKGFIYVEIKKGYPQEPEPLTRRYKGRLYSASKSNDYDADLYETTVMQNDPIAYQDGLYDEFIEFLKTEGNTRFVFCHRQDRNHQELEEAGRNIWMEAVEMTSSSTFLYPNAGKFNCGTCAFQGPCKAKNRGEDVEYLLLSTFEKRKRHYYEDAELSTDKRRD
jgi:hypothetical protein